MSRGRFVVLEGGEGSGKSTQAAILAERMGALLTREPGGTPLGARLRELLLDRDTGDIGARTEVLLMVADRAQHVAEVLRPTLAAGGDVVCDRYAGSSVAYQGAGRGLDPGEVADVSAWAADGLEPDLVVLLVVPAAVRVARTGGARDRIEDAGEEFHRRVDAGFRAQADAAPERWVVVDGVGSVDDVARRVADAVADRLDGVVGLDGAVGPDDGAGST